MWVHPLNAGRAEKGVFSVLYREITNDETKFFNYFRMSKGSFDELEKKIHQTIEKRDTHMRKSISPQERLAMTLRYLATGCSMKDLHYAYRVGVSTASEIVGEVCRAIWEDLKDEFMAQPSRERWLEIADGFKKNADFPNCIGAIDGKHVRVCKPHFSGSMYYNYKHFFSVQLLAICDANYCFTYVDVGDYGKNHGAAVYSNSLFYKKLLARALDIPDPAFLPGKNDTKMPFVLVGDEAFALSNAMVRPYGGKNLPLDKKVFNYRVSRARRFVECSFGILSNKWRIFHRPLNVNINLATDIIKACVVLHNFVRMKDGYSHEDTYSYEGFLQNEFPNNSGNPGNRPVSIRDYFKDYFVTEGNLPWQYQRV